MAKLIGSAPNQISTNGDLGSMAFEDRKNYATTNSPIYQPYRNIIINGDMSIAQRGTSTASITGAGYYTVDRFKLNMSSAGTWTQSQDTDVPSGQGFAKSMKLDCTTANGSLSSSSFLIFQQFIEGQNLQYLKKGTSSAESLTLSFWVQSAKTGTYVIELVDNNNTRSISKSYTIDSASTWEKKTITFAGDTTGAFTNDNNISLQINFWLVAGTNFTSGTLQTSWDSQVNANRAVGQVNLADNTANEFYITGVQLEAGTTASDFEFLPFDVNLGRCERYYQVVADGSQAINAAITTAAIWTSSAAYSGYTFKKTMRSSPSLDIVTGTDFYRIRSANNNYNSNTLSIGNVTNYTARLNIQSTGMTPGYSGWIAIYDQATGFVALDAEL